VSEERKSLLKENPCRLRRNCGNIIAKHIKWDIAQDILEKEKNAQGLALILRE